MRNLVHDLIAAAKALRRAPGFFAGAVLVLGLGLGVSLFAWRLLDAVVFRPLPGVARPAELVASRVGLSYPTVLEFRRAVSPALDLAGVARRTMVAEIGGEAERIASGVVTGNALSMLGVEMLAGRALVDSDDAPGAPPVVVVSARLAGRLASEPPSNRLSDQVSGASAARGADPRLVIGRSLLLNGMRFEIVGVTSPDFRRLRFGAMRDAWLTVRAWSSVRPTSLSGLSTETRSWSWLAPMGRLRPGVPVEQAQALLRAAAAAEVANYPNDTRDNLAEVLTLSSASEAAIGDLPASSRRGLVATLLAAAAAVLLLSCANVAHLVGARAAGRARELSTRRALGGGRSRLVSLLVSEALVVAVAGVLAGCAVLLAVAWGLRDVELPGGLTLGSLDLSPDALTLGLGAAMAFLATALVGLVPVWRASGERSMRALRTSSSMAAGRSRRLSAAVTVQVALGFVLLAAAMLLSRAAANGLSRDVGYRPEGLAIVAYDLALARVEPDRASMAHRDALRAALLLPGVESASITTAPPLSSDSNTESFEIPGLAFDPENAPEAEVVAAGPGLIETLGIPLLAGRGVAEADRDGAPRVAVANRAFVERYLARPGDAEAGPRLDAVLDREIALASGTVRVVGVVENILAHDFEEAPPPLLYVPLFQRPAEERLQQAHLVVRYAGAEGVDRELPLATLDAAVRQALPGVPVFDLGSFADRFEAAVGPQRLLAGALGAFGALGLMLLAAGTYAVVALRVARQRREIGVRAALGASPRRLVTHFTADGLRSVVAGLLLGVPLSIATGFLARGLLLGIAPADPLALLLGGLTVLAVGAFAAALPARSAARVEPAVVLRAD